MKIIVAVTLFSQVLFAQTAPEDPSRPDLNALRREGKLLSIQLIPKNPIKIFVVGKEEAQFDPSELKLTVRRLTPSPSKVLATTREGDHFILTEAIETNEPTNLEIKTKSKGQSETFHFKIENRRH